MPLTPPPPSWAKITGKPTTVAGFGISDIAAQVSAFDRCKAWVNFNGTGTVSIRQGFNVSSVTDNGVGDYTVNFTSAMPDANYAVVGEGAWGQNAIYAGTLNTSLNSVRTASAVQFRTENVSGNGQNPNDSPFVSIAIFR